MRFVPSRVLTKPAYPLPFLLDLISGLKCLFLAGGKDYCSFCDPPKLIPRIGRRRRAPIIPFSLNKLWLNCSLAFISSCVVKSLLEASALTLEEVEVGLGDTQGRSLRCFSQSVGATMLRVSLQKLRKLGLDGDLISPSLLASLRYSRCLDTFRWIL